jgi:hypothetical protein
MHDATRAYAAPIEHEHVRPGPASQARIRHGYEQLSQTVTQTAARVQFNLECKIIKLHSNLRIIFRCVQLFGPLARSQVESNPVRARPARRAGSDPLPVSACVIRLGDALTVTVWISCSEARSIRIAVGMYSQKSPLSHSSPCS